MIFFPFPASDLMFVHGVSERPSFTTSCMNGMMGMKGMNAYGSGTLREGPHTSTEGIMEGNGSGVLGKGVG